MGSGKWHSGQEGRESMATKKFVGASPFVGINERGADGSDFKYQRYCKYAGTGQDEVLSSPIVLALFGLGRAGSIHIANILANPRVTLKYVVEEDDKFETCRARWNLKDTVFVKPKDVSSILSDPALTACLIATPTFTHEAFIVASLDAGKAVFSEKPIAESPEGTARCYQKSVEVGKPLFCAFNRRFDPSFSSVRDQVREGAVGHVSIIKTTSRDSPLPGLAYLKISGGIFHDCAVHDIDMITWILGEYPTEIYSAATAQIPEIKEIGDHDNVAVTMKFPSGSIGMIDLNRFSNYGYDQRLEVFGPKGMLHVTNETPDSTVYSGTNGSRQVPMYYSFPSRHSDGYARELDHFLDVAQGKSQMSVTGRMTQAVSKMADACEESANTGVPVKLTWLPNEIPEDYVQQ